jgi:hypothetical protein
MTVISASLPRVEAQDPPCKGAEENQKRATKSLLSDFQPQKPQESITTATRNTPVIYFQQNRPTHISQSQKTHQNTTHTTAYGNKSHARSNQREARASATPGRPAATCLTNSRRRKATWLAPDFCHKKHLKSLTGPTTYASNNKSKTYYKFPNQIPRA